MWRSHLCKIKVITKVMLKFCETVRVKCQKMQFNMTLAIIIAKGQNSDHIGVMCQVHFTCHPFLPTNWVFCIKTIRYSLKLAIWLLQQLQVKIKGQRSPYLVWMWKVFYHQHTITKCAIFQLNWQFKHAIWLWMCYSSKKIIVSGMKA